VELRWEGQAVQEETVLSLLMRDLEPAENQLGGPSHNGPSLRGLALPRAIHADRIPTSATAPP
jgi:hypothetical protein